MRGAHREQRGTAANEGVLVDSECRGGRATTFLQRGTLAWKGTSHRSYACHAMPSNFRLPRRLEAGALPPCHPEERRTLAVRPSCSFAITRLQSGMSGLVASLKDETRPSETVVVVSADCVIPSGRG